ncbi:gliding motility lipoprotein GldB [Carboxylicivirga linearis]|uniref:Gliding motility protein GldB n=1 Tax=Carboxylicivirga linearis TaxID=1628157 RepID=A0ABS5JU51_9BACT|nr:gliding motility protein GldB [Carboxylicivirga linearis]MBS2097996.1 gliding motility protein GldB [Carboxylicivirga linearis]
MQAFNKKHLFYVVLGFILISCGRGIDTPDVSDIEVEIDSHLFFKDLFENGSENIEQKAENLKHKYGSYFYAYCQKIIGIGSPDHPEFSGRLKAFLDYDANKDVFEKCKDQYANVEEIIKGTEQAFQYYKYYFPEVSIPDLYFHISGFNQFVAVDSAWISVSVEKYLGEDCEFYEWLAEPQYLRKRMVRDKIVPDIIKAMALTSFSDRMKSNDVISSMVEKGKVLYFVHLMIPDIKKHLLFDMSKKEVKWCEKFEADIWASMVERKDLFNTDRMVIQKYTGDSPFTYYFGQDSPGRAAVYLGYQIVYEYMNNNPELSIKDLMNEKDGHMIFQQSRFRP